MSSSCSFRDWEHDSESMTPIFSCIATGSYWLLVSTVWSCLTTSDSKRCVLAGNWQVLGVRSPHKTHEVRTSMVCLNFLQFNCVRLSHNSCQFSFLDSLWPWDEPDQNCHQWWWLVCGDGSAVGSMNRMVDGLQWHLCGLWVRGAISLSVGSAFSATAHMQHPRSDINQPPIVLVTMELYRLAKEAAELWLGRRQCSHRSDCNYIHRHQEQQEGRKKGCWVD